MKISPALVMMMKLPIMTAAWSLGFPNFSGLALSNDMSLIDTPLTQMIREHDKMMERAFSTMPSSSIMLPKYDGYDKARYEIVDNDQEFKVALDVPGVDANDIHVELENNGDVLTISGSRESKGEGYMFSSKFSQSFSIDPSVQKENISAQLENGVLVVAAPKDVKKLEVTRRKIPIALKGGSTSTINDASNTKKIDVVNHEEEVMQTQ
jgi:HSP20 family protein